MTREPLLSVSSLSVEFALPTGPATALDGVSFDIAAGETLGLVGESGSGKSITALSVLRLLRSPGRVSGGRIRFEGRDLLGLSDREIRAVRGARIGFVFQEPMTALDPVYTVGDQIAEALTIHGVCGKREARTRAVDLLDAVRIPNPAVRARDYPHQMSGGMRQRVCIAIAIACRPSLVIADEPTTALDVTIQAEILELLRGMRETLGVGMLLITHDLGIVANNADRVAVMYAGRIVETGPVRDVLLDPQHPYTRGLLGSLPDRAHGGALTPIGGAVPRLGAFPSGCAFHPRCPQRFEPCDVAIPHAATVGPGHSARCFLHDAHRHATS